MLLAGVCRQNGDQAKSTCVSCPVIGFTGMTNEIIELGVASTDSALDRDLADTDLHDVANEAVRGIPVMASGRVFAL